MALLRTPDGKVLVSISDQVEDEITATSSLEGAAPAAIFDGLTEARMWVFAAAEEALFAPVRSFGREEFAPAADGANVAELFTQFQQLYYEETPEGDRLVDRIPGGCAGAVHGALEQALAWISHAEHLMRKVSPEGIADEVPSNVEPALAELASWIAQVAYRRDLDVEQVSLPTVSQVTVPDVYR